MPIENHLKLLKPREKNTAFEGKISKINDKTISFQNENVLLKTITLKINQFIDQITKIWNFAFIRVSFVGRTCIFSELYLLYI